MLLDFIQDQREMILKVAIKHGIMIVKVFGSVTSFEVGSNSEINLLVEFEEGRSLFDLIGFKQDVEDLLSIKVDVVTENSIHWSIKEDILKKAIQL